MRISLNSLSFLFFASINAFFVLLIIYFSSRGWLSYQPFAMVFFMLWLMVMLAALAISEYIEKPKKTGE
jgi:uncharacterized membrane protein